jgi:hypothetical protein
VDSSAAPRPSLLQPCSVVYIGCCVPEYCECYGDRPRSSTRVITGGTGCRQTLRSFRNVSFSNTSSALNTSNPSLLCQQPAEWVLTLVQSVASSYSNDPRHRIPTRSKALKARAPRQSVATGRAFEMRPMLAAGCTTAATWHAAPTSVPAASVHRCSYRIVAL